ncbi:MAG TPA: ABC transporter permease, partial [Halomonas sp.]|nr:ABC transporter permease [Halomonas sp.]
MSLIDALPSPSFKRRPWHPNVVLLCLSGAMLAAAWLLSFVSVAPNRIVSGTAFGMVDAISWPGAALVSLLFIAMAALSSVPTSRHYRAMLGIIILILLLMPFGLMVAGHWLVDPSLPQARLGIGAAYWTVLFVLLL